MSDEDTTTSPASGLRRLFRRREDPYAGSDPQRARRLAAVLWLFGGACVVVLLPLAPPTDAIGSRGWLLAAGAVAIGLVGAARLLATPGRVTNDELLGMNYLSLALLAMLEWLAGGHGSPYHQLFLVAAVYTACVHPPRRVLPFLLWFVVLMHVPLLYEHWHGRVLGDAALQTLVTIGLCLLGCVMMDGVRAQRVTLREQGEEDRRAAETDHLTGLGNRRRLVADLESGCAEATPEQPLLLGLYDLDGFKAYNDTYGHQSGDALLSRLGARLAAAVSPWADAYRMGGDEFCVLARTGPENREMLLAAGSEALAEAGEGFGVTASHGSVLLPAEASDPSTALRLADARMYAGKSVSRGSAGRQTADALLRVLAERDPDLGGPVSDVAALADLVAVVLGIPEHERVPLLQAAALHDVGKLAVPEAILRKPAALDEDEWGFVRRHTIVGERILGAAPALAPAARIVRSSHERYDGGGYPDGLTGTAIPLGSRVIAVCDAYHAMTSARPYRRTPMSAEGALEELRREAGGQFDPVVVNAFAQLMTGAVTPVDTAG